MHLGYERFHHDAYKQAEEALEKAYSNADMIIIAGDIFDYRHPKPEVIAEAITLFRNLSKKQFSARVTGFEGQSTTYTDIPVMAIPGTHERRAEGIVNPVDLLNFAGLLVDASQARVTVEKDLDGKKDKVAVSGIGGISEERFKEVLQRLAPKPVPGMFNVLMFHQSVYELLPFNKDFIHIDELPKGFDLYVDGHIHNKVEERCHGKRLLIPGSTVITQLKEAEQDGKGFFIYDTKDDSYGFQKIKSRKFLLVREDISEKTPEEIRSDISNKIEELLKHNQDRPILRVEVSGKMKKGFKNIDLDFQGLPKTYEDRAIVEIAKKGIDEAKSQYDLESIRHGILENVSIKDYGLGIFLQKLENNKYDQKTPPLSLFDMLSSDAKKDTVIKDALNVLFQ